MNINNSINQYNNYINNAGVSANSKTESLTGDPVSNLKQGQVFEGSINNIDSNGRVTIGLANGQTMTARLDSGVSISQGQSLFFEVKSNDGTMVQIRPVSLNLDSNPTLLKALDNASIMATEKSLNMVNAMMQESMPIDAESLASMNRTILSNPEVDAGTVVLMTKFDILVTAENANMFNNYAANQAEIFNDFDNIALNIPKVLSSDNITAEQAIALNDKISSILNEETAQVIPAQNTETTAQALVSQLLTGEAAEAQTMNVPAETAYSTDNAVPQQMSDQPTAVIVDESLPTAANNTDTIISADSTQMAQNQPVQSQTLEPQPLQAQSADVLSTEGNNTEYMNTQGTQSQVAEVIQQPAEQPAAQTAAPKFATTIDTAGSTDTAVVPQQQLVSEDTAKSFIKLASQLPDFESRVSTQLFDENQTLKPETTPRQLLSAISEYIENSEDISKEELNQIFSSKGYRQVLSDALKDSFSLKPEDITKPQALSKLYSQVQEKTEAIQHLMENMNSKAAEAIKNSASQIKSNISFMDSSNELYNFVQIPLKMYDQNTDSTLYVRQNKKEGYEKGEELTAFLHFDMQYLGSTDIYITLKNKDVACKWYLEDESSMKLIEDNIDILNERLSAKGYNCNMQVTCEEDGQADFVEDFLRADTTKVDLVHRYSFDMRA